MAKQKKVTVEGQEFTLQSVSPSWYFQTNDECGMRQLSQAITKLSLSFLSWTETLIIFRLASSSRR